MQEQDPKEFTAEQAEEMAMQFGLIVGSQKMPEGPWRFTFRKMVMDKMRKEIESETKASTIVNETSTGSNGDAGTSSNKSGTGAEGLLTLTPCKAYAMENPDDEWRSSIKGYYHDFNEATNAAKGSGWWGANGTVKTVTLHTDGKQLYKVKPLGNYKDVADKKRADMKEKIKSKLSEEELDFLKKEELD